MDIARAISQLATGCPRAVCFNPDCAKCPFSERVSEEAASAVLARLTRPFRYCQDCSQCDIGSPAGAWKLMENFDLLGSAFLSGPVSAASASVSLPLLRGYLQQCSAWVGSAQLPPDWLTRSLSRAPITEYTELFLPRCALILLELLPTAEEFALLQRVATLIVDNEKVQGVLVQWLRNYEKERVLEFVYAFQQFVTLRICESAHYSLSAEVAYAVMALDVICRCGLVPVTELANEGMNAQPLLVQHFDRWAQPRSDIPATDYFSALSYPWVLSTSMKAMVFAFDSKRQKENAVRGDMLGVFAGRSVSLAPVLELTVRRANLVSDSLNALVRNQRDLKKPLKITFVGEEGLDAGGLSKEFFQLMTKELFAVQFGMFTYYEDTHLYWFNCDSMASAEEFELVGVVLGLALFNSVVLDVRLPLATYKKLLNCPTGPEDLGELNPALLRGLEADVDVDSLGLTFEVQTTSLGAVVTHELKAGGSQVPVTCANYAEYKQRYVDWVLHTGVDAQFQAFKRGFYRMCNGRLLEIFRPEELELLLCGNPLVDFTALEQSAVYQDYTAQSPIVRWLWANLHRLNDDEKKLFLAFVTGCDRIPVTRPLRLAIVRNGPDSDRVMTSHTCVNSLLLPEYSSEEKLGRMLRLALQNSQGFGLR